ncbi:MAG: hypothetical protein JWQ10_3368 [Herbaspirillum sp.]|jgi:taurine dioxygenase|nr:hypothetical protein [Herbaspirillum sp.]
MKITALDVGFGAQVNELNLNSLSDQDKEQLRSALLKHGLLVIAGQTLMPQEQVRASEVFGTLETFPPTPSQIKGFPQIFRIASRASDGHTDVGRYWHSDGSFRAVPTPISLWHLEMQPSSGGDTLFTDLQTAYSTLPDDLKQVVTPLTTVHRNGITHPLVMQHPESGVKGLYLNIGLTSGILGMESEEAIALMKKLDEHFSRIGAVYRHQWKTGDFVIADNFHVAHRATPVSPLQRRILNRTTVQGDGAFWSVKNREVMHF